MADGLTEVTTEKEPWEDRFLDLVTETGNVTKAAKGARVARKTVYAHRKLRPDFAKRWEEAEQLGVEALEDEARRRAFAGSDTLVIFLLKAHKPDKYKERGQYDVNQRTRQEGVQRVEMVEVPWRGGDDTDTDPDQA